MWISRIWRPTDRRFPAAARGSRAPFAIVEEQGRAAGVDDAVEAASGAVSHRTGAGFDGLSIQSDFACALGYDQQLLFGVLMRRMRARTRQQAQASGDDRFQLARGTFEVDPLIPEGLVVQFDLTAVHHAVLEPRYFRRQSERSRRPHTRDLEDFPPIRHANHGTRSAAACLFPRFGVPV